MNPFLHETAGRPAAGASKPPAPPPPPPPLFPLRAGRLSARHEGPPARARPVALLTAAGIAALAWAGAAGAVDLNAATLDQLRGIRGIGPKTAQIILDERARGGRYQSFADLSDRVRGIGPRRAQSLQSAGLTIDGGGTRLSGQGAAARATAGAAGAGAPAPASQPAAGKR